MSENALDPLIELKHAIILHLKLAGGPSADLCASLLKMPDLLEDVLKHKDIRDGAIALARSITLSLAGSILSAATQHKSTDAMATLNQGIIASAKLENEHAYQCLLATIAAALRAMAITTGCQYPPVTDSQGNTL